MELSLQGLFKGLETQGRVPAARGIGLGLLGGFLGTLVMDIFLAAALTAFGKPAFMCFTLVGNTAASFFSIRGAGELEIILIGVAAHYLIGPLAGAFFGIVMARVTRLQNLTRRDTLVLSIVYIEILSQPILATAPLLLNWTTELTLLWYGGSYIMHFILGCILAVVINVGFRNFRAREVLVDEEMLA